MASPPRPMASEWRSRLEQTLRVLEQELRRGCRDELVMGGLARLGARLRDDLDGTLPDALAPVPAACADALHGYRDLAEGDRRARVEQAIGILRRALDGRSPLRAVAPRAAHEPLPPAGRPPDTQRGMGAERAQTAERGPSAGPDGTTASADAAKPPRGPRPAERRPPLPPRDSPIAEVKGVGPARAKLYQRLGIQTVGDLLWHFPGRHLAYPPPLKAMDLLFLQTASFVGRLTKLDVARHPNGLSRTTATLSDETGSVQAVWFRAGYGAITARPGDLVAVSGTLTTYARQVVFESPDWEPAEQSPTHTRRMVPVYALTSGVTQRTLRDQVRRAVDQYAAEIEDPLPPSLREAEGLPPLAAAIRQAHFPDDEAALALARRRLAFDELLLLQLMMQRRRQEWEAVRGTPLVAPDEALDALLDSQPFRFTGAQRRVLGEIRADLERSVPMARLLQGEVGSGKTAVAGAALFVAVAAGLQGVIMAPTEILAEQHARSLGEFFEHANEALIVLGAPRPRVALLVGSMSRKEKQAVYDRAAAGEVDVLVGTHALIQDGVNPERLGLAIVDEQHRFGVRQRVTLSAKGVNPHLLVMTATPIPRTLALSFYGDLDLSLLDEMPPGRRPIKTLLLGSGQRHLAYEFIRREAAEGHQSFIICPLVEGSEQIEARAATEEFERLREEDLKQLRLALLHGRMRAAEKDATMRAFREGELDVLVSTSVVEVGVDIPNATVMLIEGAERFGLAQIHQFRGRVGRGQHGGTCILLAGQEGAESGERLRAVTQASSGLELAEIDLKLRGPGDYFGERQSGLPELKVASLADLELIDRARGAARRILAQDPPLERPEHAALRDQVDAFVARAMAPS